MAVEIILMLVGLALVVFGADWLVDGASGIARKIGISEFVIGLTIVGFGTSMPELVVSLTGALEGNSDVSVGNVIGSNIFNSLMILGIVGVLSPIAITKANRKRDIPVVITVTVLFILVGMSHSLFGLGEDRIGRACGIAFLLIFTVYIFLSFKLDNKPEEETSAGKQMGLPFSILLTFAGLASLIFGGRLFVNKAVDLAEMIGVSDKFIAVTLLAGGTSLPELVTSVVACVKKKGQLALGNILGSNVFNILLIIGVSAVVSPLSFSNIDWVDVGVLLLSVVLIFTSIYTGVKNVLDRFDGVLLLACEAAYLTWLFISI